MPNHSTQPDDESVEFDPVKAKEKRAQDAEKIRQDFIRSQRLPGEPVSAPKPAPEAQEDEY
jgi:hypothetical protein